MKKLFCLIAILVLFAAPSWAVLRVERISEVGLSSKTEGADMGALEDVLQNFVARHPDADVKDMNILYHPLSGSYDVFIIYNE